MEEFGRSACTLLLILALSLSTSTSAEVLQLDENNFDSVVAGSELAFVMFYAEWCRYSRQLKPMFELASDNFENDSRIVWASVEYDEQPNITERFHVKKFPTLKLFRNNKIIVGDYKNERSVLALTEFANQALDELIKEFTKGDELEEKIDEEKRNVIAYFSPTSSETALKNFEKAASALREYCTFWLRATTEEKEATQPTILFRFPGSEFHVQFADDVNDFDRLQAWLRHKCVPAVRQLTLQNDDELREEDGPFLVLYKKAEDTESQKVFIQTILDELLDMKENVTFLVADAEKVADDLDRLEVSEADLPLIVAESFYWNEIYHFESFDDIRTPGKLRQFVRDLLSDELHHLYNPVSEPIIPSTLMPSSQEDINFFNGQEMETVTTETSFDSWMKRAFIVGAVALLCVFLKKVRADNHAMEICNQELRVSRERRVLILDAPKGKGSLPVV